MDFYKNKYVQLAAAFAAGAGVGAFFMHMKMTPSAPVTPPVVRP